MSNSNTNQTSDVTNPPSSILCHVGDTQREEVASSGSTKHMGTCSQVFNRGMGGDHKTKHTVHILKAKGQDTKHRGHDKKTFKKVASSRLTKNKKVSVDEGNCGTSEAKKAAAQEELLIEQKETKHEQKRKVVLRTPVCGGVKEPKAALLGSAMSVGEAQHILTVIERINNRKRNNGAKRLHSIFQNQLHLLSSHHKVTSQHNL